MIRNKSQQLIDSSQKKIALKKDITNLQGFQSRQEFITDAVAEIQPFVVALRAFRQKGIGDFDVTQKVDALLLMIADIEANFQNNPEWIVDNKNFKSNYFKSSLQGLKTEIKEKLIRSWRIYLTQNMPSSNKEVLDLLAVMEACRPTVQIIQELDLKIQQVEFPKNGEDFERVNQQINKLKQSLNKLFSSGEMPDVVLTFLKAAADQGAPIDLLTSEVQEWLTKRGIANSLRIRFS